ncbi:MerR family transcriptional regulator [Yinghuangia sp. YIM S09857]|uniref:MerR family transcriptional regulator n=1 Tax=Yinghuangia sp. YIM S09857 TaxID=3436929 RepID=UPI003F5324F1
MPEHPRGERPDAAPADPEAAAFTAGAVAHRLGVAVTTLRSWDRRYGIGASRASAGGHRRYTTADLARLERVCALVAEGMPLADAARLAGSAPDAVPCPAPGTDDGPESRRRGGGATLPVRAAGRAGQGLARAAMRLDADTVKALLERTFAAKGVVDGWEDLARPVLFGMGRKWERGTSAAATDKYVEVEHLLSQCVSAALHRVRPPDADPRPTPHGRGALLACTESELHTLPLEALSAALTERRLPVRMFGAALPDAALLRAVHRTTPAAVVLWSQTVDTAAPHTLAELVPIPGVTVFAAGPGWTKSQRPPGIPHLCSLPEAVALLARGI